MKGKQDIRRSIWRWPTRSIKRYFTEREWETFRSPEELGQEKSDQLFASICNRLQKHDSSRVNKRLQVYWPGIYAAAATFLLLLTVIVLWRSYISSTTEKKQKPQVASLNTVPQWKVYNNTTEKAVRVRLPDSSWMVLYAHSSAKHLEKFNDGERALFLSGKAFFEVAKDEQKPFRVYAGGLKTTVLGTSFTINTLGKGENTYVKLHTGKIQIEPLQLSKNFRKKILLPGQHFTFNRLRQREIPVTLVSKRNKDNEMRSFEKSGFTLHFNKMQLNEVLQVLAENYQVEIVLEPKLKIEHISYTGEINMQLEPIDNVLANICLLNGLTLEPNQGNRFTIHKEKTQIP